MEENLSKIQFDQETLDNIIIGLKKDKTIYRDIPTEYIHHVEVIKVARAVGIRKIINKGFDVIHNNFFVVENITFENKYNDTTTYNSTTNFDDFSSFFLFIDGNIYTNSCYFGYIFSNEELNKFSIDISKLNFTSFIDYTIDEYCIKVNKYDKINYRKGQLLKSNLERWNKKFRNCCNYTDFKRLMSNLEKTKIARNYKNLLIYNFIFYNKCSFDILMQYVNNSYFMAWELVLCLVYEPITVLENYNNTYFSPRTKKQYLRELKSFIFDLEHKLKIKVSKYFDIETHYFVYHKKVLNYQSHYRDIELKVYFSTFDEFATYLNNDLSDCNLANAIISNFDITQYKINEKTLLPFNYVDNYTYKVEKGCRDDNNFYVTQYWYDNFNNLIKQYNHNFKYFFDFAYFLKNDFSGANLIFCNGLKYIAELNRYNFSKANLHSSILQKIGIKFKDDFKEIPIIPRNIQQNELATINALELERPEIKYLGLKAYDSFIHYITDLHLLNKLDLDECKTINDATTFIKHYIRQLYHKSFRTIYYTKSIILIGGDVSSNFELFKLFIELLKEQFSNVKSKPAIIFTLGNHELWGFPQLSFDKIVKKYKKLLSDNGMYLLQDNIIAIYDKKETDTVDEDNQEIKFFEKDIIEINTKQILSIESKTLNDRLNEARLILFGGIGFSGYCKEFNAKNGIYKDTITYEQELELTNRFENLYNKVCKSLNNKQVIIFTHMPLDNWCASPTPKENFIYVSGHTHKNYFYDDGCYRIYADNQIGYERTQFKLKYFELNNEYDYFISYGDGIYQITREDYINFYRGKNIRLTFNREYHKLFMIKKYNFYMFIIQYPNGSLSILNGGAIKGLKYRDINYYYVNMDKTISYFKTPLDKYYQYQKQLASFIQSLGGTGEIHGAIVDIDYFNHIYVNPIDNTITPYYATSVIYKQVYANLQALLKEQKPNLYLNYLQVIKDNPNIVSLFKFNDNLEERTLYLEADIYRASNEVKKLQKLYSNILTTWYDFFEDNLLD